MGRYLSFLCLTFKPQSAGLSLLTAPSWKRTHPSHDVTFATHFGIVFNIGQAPDAKNETSVA
jgi:hypothetical protein